MTAETVEKKCRCGKIFYPRTVDVKRGWGRFCSKSCKAKEQEQRTGQNARYLRNQKSYLGSGVSKEIWERYRREHGGIPNFDRNGNYIGFQSMGFSDEEHDCNKDDQ